MNEQKIMPMSMYEEKFSKWTEEERKIIKTGISEIDKLNGGGLPIGITLIMGESSVGKTGLALNMAENMAEMKRNVLFFSTEMSRNVCIARGISRKSETIPYADIITGKAKEINYQAAKRKYFDKCGEHLFFAECFGGITPSEIREIIHQYSNPVVFIDYLQQLKSDDPGVKDERVRMKRIGTKLLEICNEDKIPMIIISSVSRENYGKRLGIDSGKECGELEYNAECIMGIQYTKALEKDLSREEIEKEKDNPEGRNISINTLKNRITNGTGTAHFRFISKCNLFINPSADIEKDIPLKQINNIYS